MPKTKENLYTIPGVLVFELSGKMFCEDIRNVYGFLDVDNIGLNVKIDLSNKIYFNYFGKKIPFVNFHRIFRLTALPHTDETRILFFEISGRMICLICERIIEFIAFDDKVTVHQKNMSGENYLPTDCLQYEGKSFLFPHYSEIITTWKKSNHIIKNKNRRRSVMPGKNTLPP